MALFKQTTDFKFEFKNQCCFLCYSLKILLTKQVIIIFKKYKMYPSTKKIFNFQLSVISLFQFFKVLPDAVKSIHVSLNKESCRFGSLTELKKYHLTICKAHNFLIRVSTSGFKCLDGLWIFGFGYPQMKSRIRNFGFQLFL